MYEWILTQLSYSLVRLLKLNRTPLETPIFDQKTWVRHSKENLGDNNKSVDCLWDTSHADLVTGERTREVNLNSTETQLSYLKFMSLSTQLRKMLWILFYILLSKSMTYGLKYIFFSFCFNEVILFLWHIQNQKNK